MNKKELGKLGEDIAAEYLINKDYHVIERNWRYGHGEIDIIARKKNCLVFVEVKTRINLEFGAPELAVTKNKQAQVRKIAEAYLYDKKITDFDCRIDVVAIMISRGKKTEINHIENAF